MPDLDTPLVRLVPAKIASTLQKEKGLHNARDLLDRFPTRFLDQHSSDLGAARPGTYVAFLGRVKSVERRAMKERRGTLVMAVVTNGRDDLKLTFFSDRGPQRKLEPGMTGVFAGEVSIFNGNRQLAHPTFEPFTQDDPDVERAASRTLMPVYSVIKGVTSWKISRSVQMALDAIGRIEDPVPSDVRAARRLPDLATAYALAHHPDTLGARATGMRRFAYDEALVLQLILAQRRRAQAAAPAVPRTPAPGGLLQRFDERLPFQLTTGQQEVSAEIAADLAAEHPMHRLLQGEVGSGKTIVAVRAMLSVVDAGGQAALLAPTEVLAVQHHRSISAMLGDLAESGLLGGSDVGTRVVLLTGSQTGSARAESLALAADGTAGIVIGTHALIQDRVTFADLGLIVVDEQHRFGVRQRDALRGKAKQPPHVLVMTATPIPRTVAMTVFGDMEVSTLTELPRGRSPIATHVIDNQRWYDRAWSRVAEEVGKGHQAYVVCPRIGDDDTSDPAGRPPGASEDDVTDVYDGFDDPFDSSDESNEWNGSEAPPPATEPVRPPRSVVEVAAELAERPELAGLRMAILHGRLAPEIKDAVMTGFARGEIDLLITTTVIEVGVDVPNATVMVVLDADRFGVSQLHQLRGRVGRGSAPGLCLLVAGEGGGSPVVRPQGPTLLQRGAEEEKPPKTPAQERLAAVASTNDGFELSAVDLRQRKEGDILGTSQSGKGSQLRRLRVLRDESLIVAARADATAIISDDPTLRSHPLLARIVADRLDETQAAFLERG